MKMRVPLPKKTEAVHRDKHKYNRKDKLPERDLDQEAKEFEYETGGRCGQFEVE